MDIRHSQIAVFLFKVVLQIEIRVVLTLHDRIIDRRAGNGNPTDHILILQIQLFVFRQNILALADRFVFWFFFLRRGIFHNLGNLLKGFGLLVHLCIVVVDVVAAKSRCSQKGNSGNDTNTRLILFQIHRLFLSLFSPCFLGI